MRYWGTTVVAHAADTYVLKFATLAPQGSTWMKDFDAWGNELTTKSQGRLVVKFYPGGISGDEPDMLKKIRFGQLQGAALSGHGIGEIFPPARILETPFLFRNHAEIDAARAAIQPAIEAGFRNRQYELVAWMEVGNIHFFSTKPLASLDELARRRIWQWQGDRFIDAFFNANGWSPVSLPITEVYTGLSTGLVDTVVSTPLASIALQWAGKTPYMSTQPDGDGDRRGGGVEQVLRWTARRPAGIAENHGRAAFAKTDRRYPARRPEIARGAGKDHPADGGPAKVSIWPSRPRSPARPSTRWRPGITFPPNSTGRWTPRSPIIAAAGNKVGVLRACRWLEQALTRVELGAALLAFAAMLALSVADIVGRNLFNATLPGGDVMLRQLVLWVALPGAALAVAAQRHLHLDPANLTARPALAKMDCDSLQPGCGLRLCAAHACRVGLLAGCVAEPVG